MELGEAASCAMRTTDQRVVANSGEGGVEFDTGARRLLNPMLVLRVCQRSPAFLFRSPPSVYTGRERVERLDPRTGMPLEAPK